MALTKNQAYYILFRRIEEGLEKLSATYGDNLRVWRSDGAVENKWVRLIDQRTNYASIENCFLRAQEWLADPKAQELLGGRWAEIPKIVPAEQVNVSEHPAYSNRKYPLVDVVRRRFSLGKMSVEGIAAFLLDSKDCVDATGLVDFLMQDPTREVLVRKESMALRAQVRVGALCQSFYLKNGLICYQVTDKIDFFPPAGVRSKSKLARRREVPGLPGVFIVEPSDGGNV